MTSQRSRLACEGLASVAAGEMSGDAVSELQIHLDVGVTNLTQARD